MGNPEGVADTDSERTRTAIRGNADINNMQVVEHIHLVLNHFLGSCLLDGFWNPAW